jgi:hypothetical protein
MKIIKAWAVINTENNKFVNICVFWGTHGNATFIKRYKAVQYKREYLENGKHLKIVPCIIKVAKTN